MGKELEALKRIETTFSMNKQGKESVYREYTNSIYPYYEDFDLVLNVLKRLEQIDNANPSEALNGLEFICKILNEKRIDIKWLFKNEYNTIKQALIKAQYQEKILKIIKKKDVNFEVFGAFETYKDYEIYYNNKFHLIENKLTEEEFELLKRWVDD